MRTQSARTAKLSPCASRCQSFVISATIIFVLFSFCQLMQAQKVTILHVFMGPDGSEPSGVLVRDSAGTLYGTTFFGGTYDLGTVFKLDASGNETVLYTFTGGSDGSGPNGDLVRDAVGNLYGTTRWGGDGCGCGVVFKLDTSGNQTILHTFLDSDGLQPNSGVIRDGNGNLYGTTYYGGSGAGGVVYKIDRTGKFSVLHTFRGGTDGANPVAGLIRDSAGNLYGTTQNGGQGRGRGGFGTLFKVAPGGKETVLHVFTNGSDGAYPSADLIACGTLYCGTSYGTIFSTNKSGKLTVLYSAGGNGAGFPMSRLRRDSAGNLYGTTDSGGTWSSGTIFELDAAGILTTVYNLSFNDGTAFPEGGLVGDSLGNMYGSAINGAGSKFGTIFEFTP